MSTRPLLRDVPVDRLPRLMTRLEQPAFRARQLAGWLYRRGALSWERMHNLPAALRRELADRFDLAGLTPVAEERSRDGTRKLLLRLRDGETIESVEIPMAQHRTFCISSQVGCAMACRFCATARGGLVRQLTCGEIVEQVLRLAGDAPGAEKGPRPRGFNIVFMGMGEPLDNLPRVLAAVGQMVSPGGMGISPRRITISTSGHREGLLRLIAQPVPVGLTISVNSTDPDLRRRLMPVPGRIPLAEILDLGRRYARTHRRRVTIAYVLIGGVNDTPPEARRLADLVRRGPFKVNLIPLNRIDDRWGPPEQATTLRFQEVLREHGVDAFIRASGGDDIAAACGQLRRRRRDRGVSEEPGG